MNADPFSRVWRDPALRTRALTHSSYANECRASGGSNERLEYLGDAVLGMISAEYIYGRYQDLPEGEMTKLRAAIVCEGALVELAHELDLGSHLLLGRGERAGGGANRPAVLADAVEALLAALYLDGGLPAARDFVLDFIRRKADECSQSRRVLDYKTALQEIVQKNHEETLSYRLCGESGPDHDKRFFVEVCINNNVLAVGSGRSKKHAEQDAARMALQWMGEDCE